jgi:two-component system, OmpR family, phosphate regulon sensor histidine kinase PhoR
MPGALRRWSTGSRRLALLFLVVLVPSAATLIWLGAQLVEQDRRLWADRDLERREVAADIIVRSLTRTLAAAVEQLPDGRPPDGALAVMLSARGLRTLPPGRALWSPDLASAHEAASTLFTEAEATEFRQTGDRGLSAYETFASSPDPVIRAGALLRLARVYRTTGRVDRAIDSYRSLAHLTMVSIAGMPADLLARRAICDLFEQAGRTPDLTREAAALESDFTAGRWTLDRSGWELSAEQISRWTHRSLAVTPEQRATTAAVEWLWREWRRTDDGRLGVAGRLTLRLEGIPVTMQWNTSASTISALVIPPSVATLWAREAAPTELVDAAALVLTDDTGALVSGSKPERGVRTVTRPSAETGLPWTIAITPASSTPDMAALSARRRLLASGLGAIVLLLAGGSYLLWRVVQRELAVARIQTDFLAAVSHEFRTPLTSLQHVTDLLQEDDEMEPESRRSMYAVLGRNTERLHHLIESLLDFARMEDGRKPYDLQPIDAVVLVRTVIADFSRHAAPARVDITCDLPAGPRLMLDADATALTHALWNLLDNALKYSPEPHTIDVTVGRRADRVVIAVHDKGHGIPAHERRDVFRKFVRGSDTRRRGIKGTGLGLAMVSHIVHAHGGRVELESEVDKGSTFRIVLPAAARDEGVERADTHAHNLDAFNDTPDKAPQQSGLPLTR